MSRRTKINKRMSGLEGRGMTMKPGNAVGPRGVTARHPGGTPLPPKGVAAGPEPTVTGVVAQGDRTVIVSGRNLNSVHFYVEGAATGPEVHLLGGQKGRRGMWVDHGNMSWSGHDVESAKGQYTLWLVESRSDSKIVLDLVDSAAGKVTIYGFAQDKAPGQSKHAADPSIPDVHFASGGRGKPIATTGFPKTIQFGGINTVSAKQPQPQPRKRRISRR